MCPDGGCPAREVAAEAARSLRSKAAGERLLAGQEVQLAELITANLLSLHGADVAAHLPTETRGCTVVQVLAGTSGELYLSGVLESCD